MRRIKIILAVIRLIFSDFKYDFPIPPKKPSRMFTTSFWSTVFYLYQRRKLETVPYGQSIKEFWVKHKHSQAETYQTWLRTAFVKQFQVFVSPRMFDQMLDQNPKKIFEGGCGSGATALCFLSYCEDMFDHSIHYTGVDLSEARVKTAGKYIPRFIKGLNLDVSCEFKTADLTNLEYGDEHFDISLLPSVLERVDDDQVDLLIGEVCRVSSRFVYVSDFHDRYPMGWPRTSSHLNSLFGKHGFCLVDEGYAYTTAPRNYCDIHLLFKRVN